MLKAAIFDFDGVVSDSELLHYKALNEVFADYGVNVPKEKHWAEYLGYNDLENVKAVSRDYDMALDDSRVIEIVRRKGEIFEQLVRAETSIIDGVVEFIDMLKQNGIRLAVCSGAILADIELMLQGSGLEGSFETIVAADHVKKGKPDPEGYLLAMARLNQPGGEHIEPGQCLVVEDSHWGLEAAAEAGMHRIAVTNTYPAAELTRFAEMVVDSLNKLTFEDLKCLCAD